jgi:Rieske Fe-S protein
VENEKLEHPVVLFNGEQSHRAYLLKCTHQGVELQVFGDQITCPAHGSSFDHQGTVTNGPATEPLRQFPIELFDTYLKILLQ